MASDENRKALVAEAMATLAGVEELPLDQQGALLSHAQGVLAGVLSNDPNMTRPGLPGVER